MKKGVSNGVKQAFLPFFSGLKVSTTILKGKLGRIARHLSNLSHFFTAKALRYMVLSVALLVKH